MRVLVSSCVLAASLGLSSVSYAASMDVAFEIPRISTEKYARPYVAIWAEHSGESTPFLVWHLQKKDDEWLSDLRRWWRKLGRYDNHVDALTGATKGPGHYQETFALGDLNDFTLYVEAARENGGHSLVKTKINTQDRVTEYRIPADTELGDIVITLTP
ncbi:DUF2271 domain-containing protein [Marinomonas sp. A79]|uniref:DUF2271 domain-containing protein n=1 Tax=Marinomonas vulgaris TaxID=2823372 RepID=A0ABS5HDM6_9GAMM|nr:DUF2271 domain-containing protein [Marinomonas vulgaris]MBR7889768.1 DUF2271 domain-containing protein [Marinomonas vulgaris]